MSKIMKASPKNRAQFWNWPIAQIAKLCWLGICPAAGSAFAQFLRMLSVILCQQFILKRGSRAVYRVKWMRLTVVIDPCVDASGICLADRLEDLR